MLLLTVTLEISVDVVLVRVGQSSRDTEVWTAMMYMT